jgi:hypothetical protein
MAIVHRIMHLGEVAMNASKYSFDMIPVMLAADVPISR